jgi:branched-chain amino acid transport system permease protein
VSQKRGLTGLIERISARLPAWAWVIVLVAVASSLPFLTSNTFAIRVAGNVALLATLALGLNVIVGYAGLLDLGYVAFYGVGAYTYAYLSSDFSGVHLPTPVTLVIVVVVSAFFGFLLGLPSLRLIGDYLAIVTLGFGLVFEQLMTSLTRVTLPGREGTLNLTGGPNGIPNLDQLSLFGFNASSVVDYYYVTLILLALVMLVIFHLYKSRIGRAWSALREDDLAAEVWLVRCGLCRLARLGVSGQFWDNPAYHDLCDHRAGRVGEHTGRAAGRAGDRRGAGCAA